MKYLSSNQNIMGGDLVIKGTRIPIEVILYRLKDGYSLKQVHEMYPTPSMKLLQNAIGEVIELLTPKLHGQKIL